MTTKIKTLPILVGILMLFVGACNTDDDLLVNNPQPTRTLTLTASMPNDDNPTTRIALEKNDDLSIALTWQDGDKLQLLFVQNGFIKKAIATVKNITENGKRAQFDIDFPSEMTDDNFTLYGVYGGGGLDDANPATVLLPANPGSATSLADVQTKKHVMLYFQSTDIDAANPAISVTFQHLGALFNITLKNKATTHLNNIKEVRLAGVDGDDKWAYNHNQGAQTYNLLTGEFENRGTAGNYLSFAAPNNTLASEEEIAFWGWYPPLPNKHWPALKLELWNETTATHTTVNSKQARDNDIPAGKAYYFYAVWDGTKVSFTDSSFTPEYYIEEGGLDAALGEEKDNIDAMALKGTVNSADFEVMKSMASLRHLDLSGVTITGNKIPNYAFGAAPPPEMGAKNSAPNASNTIKKSDTDATHTANTTIETVVLPDNITAIGNYAFAQCINLKGSVIIPNSVISIGDGAFDGCIKLDGTLTLSDNLETIGKEAFRDCYNLIGNLTIPEGVTTIAERAFANCSSLDGAFTLPSNMTSIEKEAFSFCSSLTGNLTIPEGLTTIESRTFLQCSNLNGKLTLPSTLTTIADGAFAGCYSLTGNLILPLNVTLIEGGAFGDCRDFEGKLTIHANISTVGMGAFNFCTGLTSLEVESVNTIIMPEAFAHCESLQSFSLPNETTYILPEVFAYCSSLTSLNLPASLKIIGQGAFMGCQELTALNLPEGLVKIKAQAFAWCSSLTTFSIPNSVTTIGDGAFTYCDGFTGNLDLSIYPNLTTLGNSAFANCSGFDGTLKLPPNITTIGQPIDSDDILEWDDELVITADGDIPWFAPLDHSVGNVFARCYGFRGNLAIPHGVTIIEEYSFVSCSGLESLSLPSTLLEIKHHAFEYCGGFEGLLTLPTSLTTIEYFAFNECAGFTGNLTIPNSVINLDGSVFVGCAGFTSITLPSHVTSIPENLFEKCSGISGTLDLSIYNNLIEIAFNAFEGCSSLTGLKLPQNIESIGNSAFKDCTGLNTRIVFPNSLNKLWYSSFSGCESVEAFRFTRTAPIQHYENMIPKNSTVEVPTDAYDSYIAAWPTYYNYVKY